MAAPWQIQPETRPWKLLCTPNDHPDILRKERAEKGPSSWMIKHICDPPVRLCMITHMDVQDTLIPVSASGGYEFLCSYSFKNTPLPTIYVPGTPAKWTPGDLPKQLNKDSGQFYRDQHGYRVPRYQFEPIFQALAIMNPMKRFEDIDIVVNRNTLQKLSSFVSMKRAYEPFHVDLDMVGNTLFISRREQNARTTQTTGYGRNFEAEFTTEDATLADAEGHHRVIQYDLGGLQVAIRIEADGYLDPKDAQAPTHNEEPKEFFGNILGVLEPASAVIPHSKDQHTRVIVGGTVMKHHQILELKSSNTSKPSTREQLWFGRTPHLDHG